VRLPGPSAEFSNDPERDYRLVVEVLEGDEWRGRLERGEEGELVLFIYPSRDGTKMPAKWLAALIASVEADLPNQAPR
jgi:hypothetical protein